MATWFLRTEPPETLMPTTSTCPNCNITIHWHDLIRNWNLHHLHQKTLSSQPTNNSNNSTTTTSTTTTRKRRNQGTTTTAAKKPRKTTTTTALDRTWSAMPSVDTADSPTDSQQHNRDALHCDTTPPHRFESTDSDTAPSLPDILASQKPAKHAKQTASQQNPTTTARKTRATSKAKAASNAKQPLQHRSNSIQ
jgi:hypothetical protein